MHENIATTTEKYTPKRAKLVNIFRASSFTTTF